MPDKPTKLQRWLDLIAFLVGRRYPVTVDEIMEAVPAYATALDTDDPAALAASRKTFERDKAELRAAGIPIETVEFMVRGTETVEGYRLARRDFYLPYLELVGRARESGERRISGVESFEVGPDEAADAGEALARVADLPAFFFHREARSALRKLAFDVPIGSPGSAELWVERPEGEAVRRRLETLADAVIRRKRVRFRYHGIYRGRTTDRDVAGYGLLFLRGHWYLIGHDRLRDAIRIFRVDRMEDLEPNRRNPQTPDYEVPDDFDLADYRGKDAWELGDDPPVEAIVRFAFPRSLWAERNAYGEAVEEEPGGATIRRFSVHQVDPFLRWVLSQEGEAEIVSPPELRTALARLARETAALHGREPAG